jgi:uncharacterized membrane protein YfcA
VDGRGAADGTAPHVVIVTALLLGLIVGTLLGLVGGGGSILAVPALVYGVGLPLSEAIPSSLIVVGAASAVAVIPRLRRGVNWRLAAIIGAAGVSTAYLGALVNRLLDQRVLLVAFAVIMIVAGVRMFLTSVAPARCRAVAPIGAVACPGRWRPGPWWASSPGCSAWAEASSSCQH